MSDSEQPKLWHICYVALEFDQEQEAEWLFSASPNMSQEKAEKLAKEHYAELQDLAKDEVEELELAECWYNQVSVDGYTIALRRL